jgi:hypothetical protein
MGIAVSVAGGAAVSLACTMLVGKLAGEYAGLAEMGGNCGRQAAEAPMVARKRRILVRIYALFLSLILPLS